MEWRSSCCCWRHVAIHFLNWRKHRFLYCINCNFYNTCIKWTIVTSRRIQRMYNSNNISEGLPVEKCSTSKWRHAFFCGAPQGLSVSVWHFFYHLYQYMVTFFCTKSVQQTMSTQKILQQSYSTGMTWSYTSIMMCSLHSNFLYLNRCLNTAQYLSHIYDW